MHKYFLIFTLLVLTVNGSSQILNSISLKERINESDLIVCGEVSDSYSFWDNNQRNIYTSYRIKVFKVLKGSEITDPDVIIKGGVVDNIWQSVSTSVELEKGDMGCFILKNLNAGNEILNNPQGKYILSGGIDGFFKLKYKVDSVLINLPATDKEICEFLERTQIQNTSLKNTENVHMKSSSATHTITGISPKIATAGTGSLLNIYGAGFGATQGSGMVWFVSADKPGYIFTNDGFEIKLWSDTLIRLIIPDEAATGNVSVNINGDYVNSPEILTIRYSYSNNNNKPYILINTDQAGGYTWHFNTNLNSNISAGKLVKEFIEKWVCATQIPWKTGETTDATSGRDGLCTISFGTIESGLGVTSSFSEGVVINSMVTEWVVKEFDIVFKDGANWCFDRGNMLPSQYDFQSVVLHELAHAHLIGHVNDNMDLMHAVISPQSIRDISSTNAECGMYILNKSLSFSNNSYRTIILSEQKIAGTPGSITGNAVVCAGQNSIAYSIPAIANATSYIWTLPSGATGTSTTNSITVNYGSNAVSGDLSVKGSNSCGTGSPSALAITVNKIPASAGTITGSAVVCEGQNSVIYSVPSIEKATSYTWTLPGGATGLSTENTITINYGLSSTSGNLTVKGSNSCGIGTSSTLAITVKKKPTTPTILLTDNILHSDVSSGNQWYYQNALIPGATYQNYGVTKDGDYYVVVTLSGCSSDASNTIQAILTGIENPITNEIIKVYPNPVSNELIIEIEGNNEKLNFEILNALGKIIFKGVLVEKTTVPTTDFAYGFYFVKIGNGKTFNFKKIIKE